MNNIPSLAGMHMYTDKKNRTIYLHPLTKKAYIIDSPAISKFYVYKNRIALLIVGILLLADYFDSWIFTIPCAIFAYGVIEWYFQHFFFAKLQILKKKQSLEKKTLLQTMIQTKEKVRIFLKAILFFVFAALLVANAHMQNATTSYYAFTILLSLGSVYYGVLHFYGLYKILKA